MSEEKSILIAEEQENINRLLAARLKKEGFRVIQTYNGIDALQVILNQPVDLVLLNMIMPHLEGVQVLRRMRAAGKTMPVIILSVKSRESDLQYCLMLGANDYLVKPLQLDDLVLRIKKLVGES